MLAEKERAKNILLKVLYLRRKLKLLHNIIIYYIITIIKLIIIL